MKTLATILRVPALMWYIKNELDQYWLCPADVQLVTYWLIRKACERVGVLQIPDKVLPGSITDFRRLESICQGMEMEVYRLFRQLSAQYGMVAAKLDIYEHDIVVHWVTGESQ